MFVDAELKFSDASGQTITSSAASTNYYDLGSARQIGVGTPLYLMVNVVGATLNDSSGTDATVVVTLETDDNTGFSTAATVQTVGTFSHGDVVGTKKVVLLAPAPSADFERYIRVYYTVANGPLDAGAFDAQLLLGAYLPGVYPDNSTITS